MPDMVNHPSHYTAGGVECIEAIRAATGSQFTGYLWGNAMKYLWRFPHKGSAVQDLMKCKWYIDRLIDEVGGISQALNKLHEMIDERKKSM